MTLFIVIATIFLFVLVGYMLIKTFDFLPANSGLSTISYALALGAGIASFQLYVYSRFAIPWSIPYIIFPWIITVLFLLAYKRNIFSLGKFEIQLKKVDYILITAIFLLLAFVGFESIIRPVSAWDAWAIWLLKAKIFFIDGHIEAGIFRYVESSYPLLVSLMSTFIYIILGKVDDTNALFLSFAFYAFLGLAFFVYIKYKTHVTYALIGTFLLLSAQNILRHGGRYEGGQADIILSCYIFLIGVLLITFLKKQKISILIFLQLLLAITALLKNEGLVFSLFTQLILWFYFIRKRQYKNIFYTFIWAIPVLDWEYFKYSNNLPKLTEVFVGSFTNFERIIPIGISMLQELFNLRNWNLLWILFLGICIVRYTLILKSPYLALYILLVLQLGLYYFLYLIFPGDPIALIGSSFNRLLLHLAPLALLLSLLEIFPLIRENQLSSLTRKFIK